MPGFIAADRHKGRYTGEPIIRRPNAGVPPPDRPALARRIGDLPPLGPGTMTPEQTIRERQEMLLAVDDGLGRIMSLLDDRGELDDTIIVVTSYHGGWYGEHWLASERLLGNAHPCVCLDARNGVLQGLRITQLDTPDREGAETIKHLMRLHGHSQGLKPGELVVVSGLARLVDGAPVKVSGPVMPKKREGKDDEPR